MPNEWLYVKLCPGDVRLMDGVVLQVVDPCRRDAVERGATRWFFMRYLDADGPHIRLRIQADTDVLNDWHDAWQHALHQRIAALRAGRAELTGSPRVVFALYEPEWDKYGNAEGVALAEEAFEVSSEAALGLVRAAPGAPTRLAVASYLMRRLARCLPSLDERMFWAYHDSFWAPPGREPVHPMALSVEANQLLDQLEQRIALAPSVTLHVDAICRATCQAIGRAQQAHVERRAAHLLLHHLHMSVNRVGVLPAQEHGLGRRIATMLEPVAPKITTSIDAFESA